MHARMHAVGPAKTLTLGFIVHRSMKTTSCSATISSGRGVCSTVDGGDMAGPSRMSWVVDIQRQVDGADMEREKADWNKRFIYKVQACIKGLNPNAYAPQVVSFGPYHHGDEHLAPMEEHKRRSLLHFLSRCQKPLESFVSAMEEVEQQVMDAYEALHESWRSDLEGFLRLMILDGCFMLEIMRYSNEVSTRATTTTMLAPKPKYTDYDSKDPVFSSHGVLNTVPFIRRDMLMMENQLPLLVLSKLVAVESTGEPTDRQSDDDINNMVLEFLGAPDKTPVSMTLGLHPLHVFRERLLRKPPQEKEQPRNEEGATIDIMWSAMQLNEAGVRFKPSKANSLRDIHFEHGVLRLPVLVVDDLTEYMLLNLMAFERLHVGAGNEVSSYVFLMDNIIDSSKDVSLLNSKGIIYNAIGSDEAVASLFNTLSKDVALRPKSDLYYVHQRVKKYCDKRWNKWRANLLRTYFHSPWAFLSLAAAVFLLVLTVAQTVFTVLQWRQG